MSNTARRRTRAEFENPDLIGTNARRWSGANLDLDLEPLEFHLGQEDLRDSVLDDLSGVPQRADANVVESTVDTDFEPLRFHMDQEDLRDSVLDDLSGVPQPEADAYDTDADGSDEGPEDLGDREDPENYDGDEWLWESPVASDEELEDSDVSVLDPEDDEEWKDPADHEFVFQDEDGNPVNAQGELMDYESFIAEREQAEVDALTDMVDRMEIENGEEEESKFLEDTREPKRLRLDEGVVVAQEATRLVLDDLNSIQRYYDSISRDIETQLERLINRQAELYQTVENVYSELRPRDSRLDIGTRFDVHLGEISSVWNTMQQAQRDLAAINASVKAGLEFQKVMPLNNYNL